MTTIDRVARRLMDADGKPEGCLIGDGYLARARAAIEAMRYADGWDEAVAIKAGAVIRVDAPLAVECHDAWIDAVLGEGA